MGFSRQEYWSGLPWPSPGESSQPREQTQVSCIPGRFFTSWATREAHEYCSGYAIPSPGESSWPRNQTGVFCNADGFFTRWAIREALPWACWSRNNQTHGFSQALGAAGMLRLLQFPPRASRRRSLYLLRLSHHRVLLSQAAVWLLFHLSLSYRDTATSSPKRIFNIWAFSYYCVLQGLQTGASHFAHHFLVVLFLFL